MILNQTEISHLIEIGIKSGKIAMHYFQDKKLEIIKKADNSPVTKADIEISALINKELKLLFPDIPIICEEGNNRKVGESKEFWLIDPIDGTNSFIKSNPEFTINIALISNNKPIFGLIFAPAIKNSPLYYTNERNQLVKFSTKDQKQEILKKSHPSPNETNIVTSTRTTEDNLDQYIKKHGLENNQINIIQLSSSLKFCYLAEEKANLYLHFRRSMEWDIAAGHALIAAYGAKILNLDGSNISYDKDQFINKPFFVN